MLETDSYDRAYVQACRTRLYEQLGARRQLREATDAELDGSAAWDLFDRILFQNLLLALDRSFMDRTRGMEGAELNALMEVRLLCIGILDHDGVLSERPTIPYAAESSVTGLEAGSQIALTEATFARLADTFLDEIEARYT